MIEKIDITEIKTSEEIYFDYYKKENVSLYLFHFFYYNVSDLVLFPAI